jgi:nucleoside 2-deoxyribosyltransferase
MRVYLAGGFYTDWRRKIELAMPQLETRDPERDNDQTASYRYVYDDLAAVATSDLVIAYFPGGYSPAGMAAEMGYAAALRIPIFYIDTTGVPTLFLVGLSKRLFTSLDHFIDWWKEREAKGLSLI